MIEPSRHLQLHKIITKLRLNLWELFKVSSNSPKIYPVTKPSQLPLAERKTPEIFSGNEIRNRPKKGADNMFVDSITSSRSKVQILSDLKYLINIELTDSHYFDNYHPLALQIVRAGTIYYSYTLFLLMKTLLRYSDVIKFDVKKAIKNECFFITQKKTGNPVRNSFIIKNDLLKEFLLFNEEKLFLNSYDGLRRWIERYMSNNYSGHKLEFSNKTHLFRHLGASFFYTKKIPIERIKSLLGHYNIESTRYYIHTI